MSPEKQWVVDVDTFAQLAGPHHAEKTGKNTYRATKDMKRSIRALLDSMKVGEELELPIFSLKKEGVLKKLSGKTFSVIRKSKYAK